MPQVTALGGAFNRPIHRSTTFRWREWDDRSQWDEHWQKFSLRLLLGEDSLLDPVEQYHDYDAQTGICGKCGSPFGHGNRQTCRGY